jgi:hypothetical protein
MFVHRLVLAVRSIVHILATTSAQFTASLCFVHSTFVQILNARKQDAILN